MSSIDERAGTSGKYFLAAHRAREEGADYSERGFQQFKPFTDMYGNTIKVVESSNIDGGVWVFCKNDDLIDPSPHLNADQIDMLIERLTEARDRIYGKTEDLADE